METIWVLLTIGVTLADKLDRTYLPPPGSTYSGGSPGAINVPLELPKTKYSTNDKEISKIRPELVIGINRVGPKKVDDTFEEISTHKPKTYDYFPSTTDKSSVFKQSSPFVNADEDFLTIPAVNYNLGHQSNGLDPHLIHKHPNTPSFDENSRVYLPPHGGVVIDNKGHVQSNNSPLPVHNGNYISDEFKHIIQPDYVSNEQSSLLYSTNQPNFNPIASTPKIPLQPNHVNNNINNVVTSNDYRSTSDTQIFPTAAITTIDKDHFIFDKNIAQRPERIQAESDRQATIVNYGQTLTPEGYAYGYDTSNGISADEEGTATNGVKAKGSYSYIGDDGNIYRVEYTADENGFLPKGAHLPTSPPIPDAILKVIEQATRDKEAGVYDDGSYNEEKYGHKKYHGGFPQANNIIAGVDFPTENGINIKEGNEFIDYQDFQGLNDKEIKSQFNNFDSKSTKPSNKQDDDSKNDSDFNNINAPGKQLNKSYNEYSSQHSENELFPNQPTEYFGNIQNPDFSIVLGNNDDINRHSESGYEYFPPQSNFGDDSNKIKSFPSRFSSITDQEFLNNPNDINMEKVTAKPFLTPYVSRKDDDSENNFDEQGNQENDEDDPIYSKFLPDSDEPIDKSTHTDGEINSTEYPRQPQYGEKVPNHLTSSDKGGYFYQNVQKPILNPHASSAGIQNTEFPTRISTTEDVNRTPGRGQPSYQTNITPLIDNFSTRSSISLLPSQTISPVILNDPTIDFPDAYKKTELISTPKSIQPSRPETVVPKFGMIYKSTTEASYPEEYRHTSTQNVVGENFSGPKQTQRFDPTTGYHY